MRILFSGFYVLHVAINVVVDNFILVHVMLLLYLLIGYSLRSALLII